MPKNRTLITKYWLGMQKDFTAAKASIFYLGPFLTVDVWDPSVFQQVMSTSKHTEKAEIAYMLLRPWLGDGLLITNGAKWHQRRHLITPTFHFEVCMHEES